MARKLFIAMGWFETLLIIWSTIPLILFPILLKVRAPYGRHAKSGWGPMISNRWGWFWMELPALLVFPLLAVFGPTTKDALSWVLIGLWGLHYVNRAVIYPFRLRTKGKKMPLLIAVSAIFFNIVNGFVNGFYIGFVDGHSGKIPSLITGLGFIIFFAGFYINNKADLKLIHLRQLGNGYQIPRGWMFDYISCPNHFGEIAEWIGFAIIARNPAALSFAIWTFCNLGPRARNHHEWYNEKFTDYPTKRKALIPFVW